MTAPALTVTVRGPVAIVRGPLAHRVRLVVAPDATWSRSGRGYVIPAAAVPDALAYAQSRHALAVLTRPATRSENDR